jgi:hypothetical protein
MLRETAGSFNAARVTDTALAAPRQIWLAGLGAATVTRQWAMNDAGNVFRSLVKEGATVESRARRVIGRQVDNSLALATSAWNGARRTALTTMSGLFDAAAATLPRFRAPATGHAAKTTRRTPAKGRKARRSKRKA